MLRFSDYTARIVPENETEVMMVHGWEKVKMRLDEVIHTYPCRIEGSISVTGNFKNGLIWNFQIENKDIKEQLEIIARQLGVFNSAILPSFYFSQKSIWDCI